MKIAIREVFGIGDDDVPIFDLIFLGYGSRMGIRPRLCPDSDVINENERLAAPVYLDEQINRITLTVPVLLNAAKLVVMVSGAR